MKWLQSLIADDGGDFKCSWLVGRLAVGCLLPKISNRFTCTPPEFVHFNEATIFVTLLPMSHLWWILQMCMAVRLSVAHHLHSPAQMVDTRTFGLIALEIIAHTGGECIAEHLN